MELTLDEALKKGIEAHKAGKVHEALPFFKTAIDTNPSVAAFWLDYIDTLIKLNRIVDAKAVFARAKNKGAKGDGFDQLEIHFSELSINPQDPPSNQLQAIISLFTQGQLKQALTNASQMLERFPNSAVLYNIAGASNAGLMQFDAAIDKYKQSLKIKPDYAKAYNNMAVALNHKGDSKAAVDSCQQALKIEPDYADAYINMGIALNDQGDRDAAIDSYKQALKINPLDAEVYNNMGVALRDKGDLMAAIESCKQSLKINPDFAEAYYNMGNALSDIGDIKAAISSFKQALKINPNYEKAYYNMGNTLNDKGDFEAAINSYKQAIKIKPEYVEAYINMGLALKDKGDLEAAIEIYKQALKIKPDYAEAYYNKSLVNLCLQNFEAGWSHYEWRWKLAKVFSNSLKSSKPLWKPSKKERVLLWCEQGVGDEIMFASLIPDLYSSSSKLIVLIDKRLISLFRRSFPDDIDFRPSNEVVSETEYDSQIPMGSVPLHFRQSIASFKKSAQGWLSASTVKAQDLRSHLLSDDSESLIGISWHSTANMKSKAGSKVIPLNKIAPFMNSSKVKLVSLQYGEVDDEISKLLIDYGIKITQVPEIDNMNDIDGLAALISACDEVVSIDNVTAHLAGSLGIKSKILLTSSCNWNWGQSQHNSYWYSSVHLYRQSKIDDWEHVIKQL